MEKAETILEAERWKDVAAKLLENQDLLGSKRFAKRAQDLYQQVEGVDQIISIIDVLLASEKRINNHFDWYAILQLDCRSNDLELIRRQYRKLCLLLHPDKNQYSFSDNAFKLVCDAWAFLSDSSKKSLYDNEFNLCKKYDPIVLRQNQPPPPSRAAPPRPPPQKPPHHTQTPVRRSGREKRKNAKSFSAEAMAEMEDTTTDQNDSTAQDQAQNGNAAQVPAPSKLSTFWTTCPYCYHLYEYPRVYEDCCLRCQNCRRGFHAVVVASPPPAVGPEKDMYYCCWAFFPVGYTTPGNAGKNSNWTPFTGMFAVPSQPGEVETEDRMASRNDSVREDDLMDSRSVKKGRTENLSNNVMKEKNFASSEAEMVKEASENTFKTTNVGTDKDAPSGSGPNTVEPQKMLRVKTTARKSIRPKPNNQIPAEVQNKSPGGKSNPDWVCMDLNLEVRPEPEEPNNADGVGGIEIGSIDNEATEGIGFFEGLEEILGSLPILSVPGSQKAGNAK